MKGAGETVVICICGMTGCGKSTVAKRLAEKYGLRYVSGGDALKDLAAEEGYEAVERGWWETDEGRKFLKQRTEDPRFDRKIDEQLIKWADRGDVIIDSWTIPWLLQKGFKIWLEASREARARRIATRDGISVDEALYALKEKDEKSKKIYKKHYGFDFSEDFSPFQLIVDTSDLNIDEVSRTICMAIDRFVSGKLEVNAQ